jgi:hypothetical protein
MIGPKIKHHCMGCECHEQERYQCQGDSGFDHYCKHPDFPERKSIGDSYITPEWCPVLQKQWIVQIPAELNPKTASLILGFAQAMAEKLKKAQDKYGYEADWSRDDWMDECREHLRVHLEKGDPLDVSNYCAFLWYHKESTKVRA